MSELRQLFKKYLSNYDLNISTLDDIHNEKLIKEKINFANYSMRNLQQISEENIIKKCGTDKTKAGKMILENMENKWYKNIDKSCDLLLSIEYSITNLFELKNRKSEENFELRAEINQLKTKLLNYERPKN